MRAACLVVLASCAVSLPVPLEPSPITKGAGKRPYEKAGVPLDASCGDRFEQAVSDVDDAVRDVQACHTATDVALWSFGGSVVFAMAAASSATAGERGMVLDAEIGVAVTSLVVGYVAALISWRREHRAVDEYNAAIAR